MKFHVWVLTVCLFFLCYYPFHCSALFCVMWHGIPDAVSLGIQIAKTMILVVFAVSLWRCLISEPETNKLKVSFVLFLTVIVCCRTCHQDNIHFSRSTNEVPLVFVLCLPSQGAWDLILYRKELEVRSFLLFHWVLKDIVLSFFKKNRRSS